MRKPRRCRRSKATSCCSRFRAARASRRGSSAKHWGDGAPTLDSHRGRPRIFLLRFTPSRSPPSPPHRQPASSPLHHESQYSHGFDSEVAAPGSSHSLYLSGGNDANFGMTLKLPATALEAEPPEHSPVAGGGPGESEYEDAAALNGKFQPDAVSFYVRTDNSLADAGHFILGESNEVNRRVAQFQFTRDGKMGLLGTGGTTHGATPYESNRWYHVMLCFDWKRKTVAFSVDGKLLQRSVPFRREASNFIGACALGNRDRCTTWFDSIRFVQETTLNRVAVSIVDGVAETWLGPLGEDEEGRSLAARDGFVLRAEDADGQVSELAGPYHPLCRIEGAQRVAINNAALADFNTLLADDASADVTFVVGGRDVPAHRCILAARCETFRRMFNSSMREGSREEGQRVPIAEVSHAAFSCMLQYIYSGAVAVPEVTTPSHPPPPLPLPSPPPQPRGGRRGLLPALPRRPPSLLRSSGPRSLPSSCSASRTATCSRGSSCSAASRSRAWSPQTPWLPSCRPPTGTTRRRRSSRRTACSSSSPTTRRSSTRPPSRSSPRARSCCWR